VLRIAAGAARRRLRLSIESGTIGATTAASRSIGAAVGKRRRRLIESSMFGSTTAASRRTAAAVGTLAEAEAAAAAGCVTEIGEAGSRADVTVRARSGMCRGSRGRVAALETLTSGLTAGVRT
jgi:hypothetical protein